jgi:DNA topoisomerase I
MAQAKIDNLIIVESPAKAKTIEKYLGKGYVVTASIGHLIDLPQSRLAINVDSNNFEPEYITIRGKAKILKEILKLAKSSQNVLLASDNDREGEAIAFHIRNAILSKFPDLPIRRIVFNEITPRVIKEAVEHPMDIDLNKVNAQKARRVLDRLVGYRLSPILWSKVKNGLSAGRVQSVALRLVCERDREVEAFVPEEYWSLDAVLKKGKRHFDASFTLYKGEKVSIPSKEEADKYIAMFKDGVFRVIEVKQKEKLIYSIPPFTTSKLQQAAASRFGFTSRRTMGIAQSLYEGVNIGEERVGLITYMRTDSTRVSEVAIAEARTFIGENYPADLPEKAVYYTTAKQAQDAHEAIRPTFVSKTPEMVSEFLTPEQLKLYSIIWERFVSSQMKPVKTMGTTCDIECNEGLFRATATTIVEKGFYRALKLLLPKEATKDIPKLAAGETLECTEWKPEQHYTQGPSHYTDASIIKALEELGIGRPSTYAPIISVLLDRYYVVRKERKLTATVLGKIISDLLAKTFPTIIDASFTAEMERKLDNVEENAGDWVPMIRDFYAPFQTQVEHVMTHLESIKGILDEPTDYTCEKCGKPMIKKLGRFGFFIACSGFPACMNSKPVPLAECPKPGCGGKIVAKRRKGRGGKVFYGCSNYPACDFITYFLPVDVKCPKCGYFLVEKSDKKRGEMRACSNPECDYVLVHEEADKVG